MNAELARAVDRLSIWAACRTVPSGCGTSNHVADALALMQHPDFFGDFVSAPRDLNFVGADRFRFRSPLPSGWAENDTVPGRLFRCDTNWQTHPTVILLHGWNSEVGYRVLFPQIARRLNRAGLNAAMIEMPHHGRRKSTDAGAPANFLSDDLLGVVTAARQAIADTRAMVAWLQAQGCARIGVWGISLGAWLGGLVACADARLEFAVLMTPVSRMDRVIYDLKFCAPLRRRLDGVSVQLTLLNLDAHRPRIAPENILFVAAEHDLFAPLATVEALWRVWGQPKLHRVPHGHMTVLASPTVMRQTVKWIASRSRA